MKLKTKLLFAVVVTTAIFISSLLGGCASSKYGCPGAHSQGRVPGRFTK